MRYTPILSLWFAALLAVGCSTQTPRGITPVENFQLERYLGEWYEIARLDHRFERDLTAVRAHYSRRDDGGVNVVNMGYNAEEGEWEAASARAYFVDGPDVGHLKVSFFGPFYSAYVIFELDQSDYQYAFVSGSDREYLWLLAREPEIPAAVKQQFERRATELGFDVSELKYVSHRDVPPPPADLLSDH